MAIIKIPKNTMNLIQLIFFTVLVLFLVLYFDKRQQFTLTLYKLSLASAAAVLGIWIDKLTFPDIPVESLRRAFIIAACIVGVCMGL